MIHPGKISFRAILALLLVSSCSAQMYGREKPVRILTSIFPLQDLARSVAGDRGEVALLLPPGSDVHTWQPRPGDILRMSRADLFIYIGSGLEPWVDVLLRGQDLRGGRVLEAGKGLAGRTSLAVGHDHDTSRGRDPHIWLDLGLDVSLILRIREALTALDPSGGEVYRLNAERAVRSLRALDAEFRRGLSGCRSKTIVLGGHAAFGYLAARYGLKQVSLYGLSPDSEPTPRHLVKVAETVRSLGLKFIFYEENSNRRMAEVLAGETGAELLGLHPGHNLTREQLEAGLGFLDIMRRNLRNLRRGLGCE